MQSVSRRQTPNEFLKKIVGKPVVVKLNSGVDYRGFLINKYLNWRKIFKNGKKNV